MKINKRQFVGLSAVAAAASAWPRIARACDEEWVRDIVWVPANDGNSHLVTMREMGPGIRTFQMAFAVGSADNLQRDLFYGNRWAAWEEFTGIAPFCNTRDPTQAQNAVNVLHGGNTDETNNSSIFIIGWGEQKVYMVRALGGKVALVPHDWRYMVRAANIATQGEPNIDRLLFMGLFKLPSFAGAVIYMNERVAALLERQTGYIGNYRKIPIRIVDAIRNDEPLV
jgi:hypothetical protein